MRTRTKWAVLAGLAVTSIALVHCVGDDPSAGPTNSADGGGDDGNISDSGPGADTGPSADAGPDAASPCAAGVSPCITQIAGGGQTFCARDFQGKAYCWGDNRSGQLAKDPYADMRFSATPVPIDLGGQFALSVGVGGSHLLSAGDSVACARVNAGGGANPATVMCWGSNGSGQLGNPLDASTTVDDGGQPYIAKATQIPSISGSTEIAVGALHVCSLSATNLFCWGENTYGELARVTPGQTDYVPQPVTFAGGPVVASDIVVGARHTCSANSTASGRVGCAGNNSSGQLGRGDVAADDSNAASSIFVVGNGTPVLSKHLATAGNTTCAITSGNGVVCWGANDEGEVGNGNDTTPVTLPTAVVGLNGTTPVIGLQAGYAHFCALLAVPDNTDGAVAQNVYCWGSNDFGESGPADGGTGTEALVPYPVPGLPGRAASLAIGSQASCALLTDGSVWCWGEDYLGELGNKTNDGGLVGPASLPVKITF